MSAVHPIIRIHVAGILILVVGMAEAQQRPGNAARSGQSTDPLMFPPPQPISSLPNPLLSQYEILSPQPASPPKLFGGGWQCVSAIDGSKQPQDYGVNANIGFRQAIGYAGPLVEDYGIGFQIGTAVAASDNAVRVFELMGEDTTRFQNHSTAGLFYRGDRWAAGVAYDHLYQDGFDTVSLSQWRTRLLYSQCDCRQFGISARLRGRDDDATYGADRVTLRSINQLDLLWRQFWSSGVQTTSWIGLADEHGGNNAAFGPSDGHDNAFVFGSEFIAPITPSLAIFGETDLMFPADTGTVDAYLGVAWYPGRRARNINRGQYDALFNIASNPTFSVDLIR